MDLRELKKEVEKLPNLELDAKKLNESLIRPIRTGILPFWPTIQKDQKREINRHITRIADLLPALKSGQFVNEKLRQYAHYLIELKLATINGHEQKKRLLVQHLLNDNVLSLQQTIADVSSFQQTISLLKQYYEEASATIDRNLKLEDRVAFQELPHRRHMKKIEQTAQDQQKLASALGKHFVVLARR
ncbi:hypothetical protein HYX14_02620 [Candidatus Woesearchaeota archaeon]|nr:hypothetical protein [Candidatus Woesearchaeota archaeon]